MNSSVSTYFCPPSRSLQNLFLQDLSDDSTLKVPTRKSEFLRFHNLYKHVKMELFYSLFMPLMDKKTPDFVIQKMALRHRGKGQTQPITTRSKIPALINRLGDRYLETVYIYQQLDKRYRRNIAVLKKGTDYPPRKGR